MEPTAAMAHTRLADGSIPEPSGEAAVTDASARRIQRERERKAEGEGSRRWKERGGEMGMGKTEASPRFLVCDRRLALLEQRLPAQLCACPPLKPPATRPVSHSHAWQGAIHTHPDTDTHTHTSVFCIFEKK